MKTFKRDGKEYKFLLSTYKTNNRLAILITDAANETVDMMSYNAPWISLKPDEFLVKEGDFSEAFKDMFSDTGLRVKLSNRLEVPIWRLRYVDKIVVMKSSLQKTKYTVLEPGPDVWISEPVAIFDDFDEAFAWIKQQPSSLNIEYQPKQVPFRP